MWRLHCYKSDPVGRMTLYDLGITGWVRKEFGEGEAERCW